MSFYNHILTPIYRNLHFHCCKVVGRQQLCAAASKLGVEALPEDICKQVELDLILDSCFPKKKNCLHQLSNHINSHKIY